MAPKAEVQVKLEGGVTETGGWQRYEPGGHLYGRVLILPSSSLRANHVWARLQWHTEGRGDRDVGRVAEQDLYQGQLAANVPLEYVFHFQLPTEPWSYAGHYVNIVWSVMAEIDVPLAPDLRASQLFILAPR